MKLFIKLFSITVMILLFSCSEETKLFMAIKNVDIKGVANILNNNEINLDVRSSQGSTPLWLACTSQQTEIVELLLSHGANPNGRIRRYDDENRHPDDVERGPAPLWEACSSDNVEIIKLLLEYGAGISQNDNPIISTYYNANYEIFELLIARRGSRAYFINHLHIITEVIDHNKWHTYNDINEYNERKEILIRMAKFLIDDGIDINDINVDGNTALHIACKMGPIEMVQLLIDNGANINAKNSQEDLLYTPLHCAVIYRNGLIVKYLIENGANISIKNRYYKQSAYDLAIQRESEEIIEIFEQFQK